MNHFAVRSSVADLRSVVVCPKPRRIEHPLRPVRFPMSHHADADDSRSELLDFILTKGSCGAEESSTEAVLSPFFCGSPPSRASNPLVHDSRFGDESFSPFSTQPMQIPGSPASPSAASARKGGCVRASFGNNPAVRIEGFVCLDRDRRNCSIPALA